MPRREFLARGLGAALIAPLYGCGLGSVEPPILTGPELLARPGAPTLPAPRGLTALNLGGERDGLLYVPASYSEDQAAPLLLGLHGATGDADNWQSYHARAEQRGMVFLAPDSRRFTWDIVVGGLGPDVRFIDRALEFTFDRCRIDPSRIALAGFSDGASYALSLGVANGDLFSHLIGYSPGFLRVLDVVGNPRVWISHGTDDGVLPVSLSRDNIVPRLENTGYDVHYEEFEGGHTVPAEITEMALDWFLE